MMSPRQLTGILIFVLSFVSLVGSLCLGTFTFSPLELLPLFNNPTDTSVAYEVIVNLRLPRALSAYTVGALLALAGCLMQAIFQNPLADSYLLGTSSGATLAMLIGVILAIPMALYPLLAASGAWLSVFLVILISRAGWARYGLSFSSPGLLLIGVMVGAIFNTGTLLLLTLLPDYALRGTVFWMIGDLHYTEYWPLAMIFLILAGGLSILFGQVLNIASYGNLQAQALGIRAFLLFTFIVLVIGAIAGICVAIAGPIGFIGLIVPHFSRRLMGYDLRRVIPTSMGIGGILLVLAELCARTVAAPLVLPVGIFTALLGAPCFLWFFLMQRKRST